MKQTPITFETYLHQRGFVAETINSYNKRYQKLMAENINPETFSFKEILSFLDNKAKASKYPNTNKNWLGILKVYYDYLVAIGFRDDHPCKTFNIKSHRNKNVIHQDLFLSHELEMLLEREERYEDLRLKHLTINSLLIYQGLESAEIRRLKVQHIDFDSGLIFIKGSRNLKQRHLEIYPKQFKILDDYIKECRPKWLKEKTDFLLMGRTGGGMTCVGIAHAVIPLKGLFPDRKLNPKTIRQSVIANWLNEKKIPLEQVQLMSGQKWISTTIKYRQNSHEEQRELMNRWFPI